MAQHVTVVLNNGSKSHFHAEDSAMFDGDEGILVIYDLTGATVNFNKDNVLAWITTEMSDEELHATKQIIQDRANGVVPEQPEGGLDDGDPGVPV
jgi:hypothetical protein